MLIQYRQFQVGDTVVNLPIYTPSQDHSPPPMKSRYVETASGVVDVLEEDESELEGQTSHSLSGYYLGVTTYLVDENGNKFVDDEGNYFIFGDGPTMLRSKLAALRSVYPKRGILWGEDVELTGRRFWKRATFSGMTHQMDISDRMARAIVSCEFTTNMMNWHSEDITTISVEAIPTLPVSLFVHNDGNVTIDDAKLTVISVYGGVTSVAVSCVDLGIDLTWEGTLLANEALVLADGDERLPDSAEGVFAEFSEGPGHTAESWLPIPPGQWVFDITVQGSLANVELSYYHQEI